MAFRDFKIDDLGKFARRYAAIARRDEERDREKRKQEAEEARKQRRERPHPNPPEVTPEDLKALAEQLASLTVDYDRKTGRLLVRRKPKSEQARCGAKGRDGHPCQIRLEAGQKRCARHGGKSTGPKTPEGRVRIAESNRRRAEAK